MEFGLQWFMDLGEQGKGRFVQAGGQLCFSQHLKFTGSGTVLAGKTDREKDRDSLNCLVLREDSVLPAQLPPKCLFGVYLCASPRVMYRTKSLEDISS
jgi:hypothetical protein